MPLPLGVMLVTASLAMSHGTCSLATAGGPPVLTPLLQNYKSHHASAFGRHVCNCQSCNASWDL
ncbi:unnamed protein product [Staurois parvus]|uniref:Uncharacterized protein n=1 Tax=Staurois parvus TaxID=386267 RepID=A0ABN9C4I4_9NEOB|nr:unnamed protein product [Staurois parvus]